MVSSKTSRHTDLVLAQIVLQNQNDVVHTTVHAKALASNWTTTWNGLSMYTTTKETEFGANSNLTTFIIRITSKTGPL